MPTHSVRRHLRLEIDAYDDTIRRFIPGYEEMLRLAAATLAPLRPELVIDLGAGTGALSEAILEHGHAAAVELIDVDDEMLAQARTRLARFGDRVRLRRQSFRDPLPACDGVAASLALHHVPTLGEKQAVYANIREALRPGGMFVNADAVMPADQAGRDAAYGAWADHMVACGIEREARLRSTSQNGPKKIPTFRWRRSLQRCGPPASTHGASGSATRWPWWLDRRPGRQPARPETCARRGRRR